MASSYDIETDLAIIGGGIMGTAVAFHAAALGIKLVVLENKAISGDHYSTGFWAPRTDYLPKDIDEVRRTDVDCINWHCFLPELIKPRMFLLPVNRNSPHSFESFRSLMELYDKLTPNRLRIIPSPHFLVDGASLSKMEPNLKKGHFDKAIGFYELVADVNKVRDALWTRVCEIDGRCRRVIVSNFVFHGTNGHLDYLTTSRPDGSSAKIGNSKGNFVVVNAAGPWMNEVAGLIDIKLPVSLYAGVQLVFSEKYSFSSILLTFAKDGKYIATVSQKDYLQVGPSNFLISDKLGDLKGDSERLRQSVDWIREAFMDFVEPGFISKEPIIKAIGARVKLDLPFGLDSNRHFIIPGDQWGIDNFFSVYPGKLPSSLRTASELLKLILRRDLVVSNPKFYMSSLMSRNAMIVTGSRLDSPPIIMARIKSLAIVGKKLFFDKFRKIIKAR